MSLIAEFDRIRRLAKVAAQAAYVNALIAGDAEAAAALLPASQHGTLERNLLEQFGLVEDYDYVVEQAQEAAQEVAIQEDLQ